MSGQGQGDERTPDLTDAVLGFRVWKIAPDGRLGALVAGSFWEPGRNEAVCSPFLAASKRPHKAPQPGCNCGFNAYFLLNSKLRPDLSTALGTIAAWGELDVYADGFRAQYAQVIALSCPENVAKRSDPTRDRLELAAERYGVPLVPIPDLKSESLRHATPVDEAMKPDRNADPAPPPPRRPRRNAPQQPPGTAPTRPVVSVASWKQARGHAIWVARHVTVNARKTGVEIGLAPGAAAVASPAPDVKVAPIGLRVEADDAIASVTSAYPGHTIHLRTPVGGVVRGHNTDFVANLRDGNRAVSSAPWLVEVEPDDTPLEDAPLLWGRPGVEIYRRGVSRQNDRQVLTDVCARDLADTCTRLTTPGASPGAALAPHQRSTTSVAPEKGRRAAIMVEHLRPLLQACGEEGSLLAA